ncbi:DUF2199 domain-containing protein [Hymenobacter lucidus]|uniref:DUF2199 domain-containing protein n=1 Tax=Hymenobacter lucidus TaxID=2880930 RepID=A0ABS8AW64_9BACT|nr:DUF2199 domain-containing protein [Hymenobacter lucidus]MCB2409536.1 DUF2199 domain-containing protein [Hymenobacter lucidus]
MSYLCACCGQLHEGLPDVGFAKPDPYFTIPQAEREERIELTTDTCVINNEEFFIRGLIELPVHGQETTFGLGVWVSQKDENFETYRRNPDTADIGPYFGWLCSDIPAFGSTSSLKTMVHFQGNGLRPWIELEPTDHPPLAVAQRDGISLERAWEIVHEYIKPEDLSV